VVVAGVLETGLEGGKLILVSATLRGHISDIRLFAEWFAGEYQAPFEITRLTPVAVRAYKWSSASRSKRGADGMSHVNP
jgi:hypothetical protein